jgi:hypothetical protein
LATITLSVPNELKSKMDKSDWVNWSSVARRAFAETLEDVTALKAMKKVRELSEIADSDKREVSLSVAKEVIKSVEKGAKKIREGKKHGISADEFELWCNSI